MAARNAAPAAIDAAQSRMRKSGNRFFARILLRL
jgi:hypothetical protein